MTLNRRQKSPGSFYNCSFFTPFQTKNAETFTGSAFHWSTRDPPGTRPMPIVNTFMAEVRF